MGIESPLHLLFLGAIALLVLGPKRLPELAKALGKGIREFREAIDLGEDREGTASSNGSPPATPDRAATTQAQLPPPQGPSAPAED
jgi:TatA/E family protein of Tat protein translocase